MARFTGLIEMTFSVIVTPKAVAKYQANASQEKLENSIMVD